MVRTQIEKVSLTNLSRKTDFFFSKLDEETPGMLDSVGNSSIIIYMYKNIQWLSMMSQGVNELTNNQNWHIMSIHYQTRTKNSNAYNKFTAYTIFIVSITEVD